MDRVEGGRPLYQRLRNQIASEIAQNIWHPGEAISTEAELATRYQISVGTVRRAIDVLVLDGLIERRNGSGMFVRRPDFNTSFIRFTRVWGSAGDRRVPQSFIYKAETLPGSLTVTSALNLPDGATVIKLLRLRTFEERSIIYEEIWLNEARFNKTLTVIGEQPRLLYPIYENLCGAVVARAEEIITIDVANETDIRLLGIETGASIVSVERLSLGYDDQPIELRYSRSPAADFHYKVELR